MIDYRDRHSALVGFGILQIFLGLFCVLLVLGIAAALEIASRGGAVRPANVASAFVLYGAAAFYFIAVGIGSIRARRWAQAMSVAFAAVWVAVGIGLLFSAILLLQRMLVFVRPSESKVVVAASVGIFLLAFIVLPLILFFFYRRDDVRLTVEARDPRVRWTDRVPWPVLAVAMAMAFSAVAMLANIGAPAVPFFTLVLTGAPAALTTLALAGLFGFLAVQWVQLKKSAWWTALLLHIFVGIAGAVSLAAGDIGAAYTKMHMPQQQVQAMQLDTLTRNPMLWIFAAAVWLAYLAILLRVRRYFDAPDPRTRAGDGMLAATT